MSLGGVSGREITHYSIPEPWLFPLSFQGLGNGLIKVEPALSHLVSTRLQESLHLPEFFIPPL